MDGAAVLGGQETLRLLAQPLLQVNLEFWISIDCYLFLTIVLEQINCYFGVYNHLVSLKSGSFFHVLFIFSIVL